MSYVDQNQMYCLISNNCEMFADYCCTGIMPSVSRQVLNNVQKIMNGNELLSNINTLVVDYMIDLLE
mgnify:CR=1 FL=1